MDWKRLTEGDIAACSHPGGTKFFQVEAGWVVWWAPCVRTSRPPAPQRYMCRDRRCRRAFWGIGVPADQAGRPPEVAA